MIRKLSLLVAVGAALAMMSPANAFNGKGGPHPGGPHPGGQQHPGQWKHPIPKHPLGGHHPPGGMYLQYGKHPGHWYHGHYYKYGVGPCWRRNPDGEWTWIC